MVVSGEGRLGEVMRESLIPRELMEVSREFVDVDGRSSCEKVLFFVVYNPP
jgi:hypothetical protein